MLKTDFTQTKDSVTELKEWLTQPIYQKLMIA